ncbi:MAG: hypothetical protein KJ624_03425 [Chloroflexi bacterium]|nr:hypothetical protein [Chloroflexota bacterium]
MKGRYSKPFKLVMALALVVGLVPIMATPAQACIAIDIYPSSGPVGTEVTIFYFNAHQHAGEVELGPLNAGVRPNSVTFGGFPTTHKVGTYKEGEFTIVVPDVPPEDYLVNVPNGIGTTHDFETFTVTEGPVKRNPHWGVVGHILAPIDGKYEEVWGFDPATQTWELYDPAYAAISDLMALVTGHGYWIKAREDVTILWGTNYYLLRKGWNFIIWLGP